MNTVAEYFGIYDILGGNWAGSHYEGWKFFLSHISALTVWVST